MSNPTPEEFMAQRDTEELGEDQEGVAELDPLTSIAKSLQQLVAATAQSTGGCTDCERLRAESIEMEEAWERATERAVLAESRLDRIAGVVKPSVSKLANQVREVLDPPGAVEAAEPDGEPPVEAKLDAQPADDAEVEEWRAYARSRGYAGPDVDKANRSQIRSMLGIQHPATEVHNPEATQ